MTINGREYNIEFNLTLATQIKVGLWSMKRQQEIEKMGISAYNYSEEIKKEIALAEKENRQPKLPKMKRNIIPFSWKIKFASWLSWYSFLKLAIKRGFIWKLFRIPPRKLWYSVIPAEDASEIKKNFFANWEAILPEQEEPKNSSMNLVQNSTE